MGANYSRTKRAVLRSQWADGSLVRDVTERMARLASSGAISAMAFDLFLASIPLLGLLGWALAKVAAAHPDEVVDLTRLLKLTPDHVQQVVVTHTQRVGVGAAPLIFLGSVWLASSALHTPMVMLERTLGLPARRWWERRAIAIGSVLAALASVVLGASLSISLMGGSSGLLRGYLLVLQVPGAQLPSFEYMGVWVAGALLCALLAGFFRVVVYRPPPRAIVPGCVATLAAGTMASGLLGLYVRHLSTVAAYYGSLTAVAVFLTWLWMCSAALLLGAVLNLCLEKRR